MRLWAGQHHTSMNRTPTACPASSCGRCRRQETLSLFSCQRLQAPAVPKRVAPATPTPFGTGCTRCWQHLETRLKIVSIMSQC